MSTPSGHGSGPSQARYHVTFSPLFAICRAFLRVSADRASLARHLEIAARLVPTRQRCAVRGISSDVNGVNGPSRLPREPPAREENLRARRHCVGRGPKHRPADVRTHPYIDDWCGTHVALLGAQWASCFNPMAVDGGIAERRGAARARDGS